jgi:hypothetical protein
LFCFRLGASSREQNSQTDEADGQDEHNFCEFVHEALCPEYLSTKDAVTNCRDSKTISMRESLVAGRRVAGSATHRTEHGTFLTERRKPMAK